MQIGIPCRHELLCSGEFWLVAIPTLIILAIALGKWDKARRQRHKKTKEK